MKPYTLCSEALPPLKVTVLAIIDGEPKLAAYDHFTRGDKAYSFWSDGCYEWEPYQVTMWMLIPDYTK